MPPVRAGPEKILMIPPQRATTHSLKDLPKQKYWRGIDVREPAIIDSAAIFLIRPSVSVVYTETSFSTQPKEQNHERDDLQRCCCIHPRRSKT